MSRMRFWVLFSLFTFSGALRAEDAPIEDIRGSFQKLDEKRQTVTIRIDGKDNTFEFRKIRFFDDLNRELSGGVPEARKYFREGQPVILTVERSKQRLSTRLRAAPSEKK